MTHLSEAILQNTRGVTLTLKDPLVCTLLRDKVDFFVFDAVASPVSPEILSALISAAGDTPFLVRTAPNISALQSYLNLGVDGLILTDIQYASEAEKTLAACLYPPEGVRPYQPCTATKFRPANDISLEALNDQITLVIEVAHPQTVAQANEIAEVTGVDGFLICAEKLSVAMEKGFSADNAEVIQAIETIIRVADSYELPLGWDGELTAAQTASFQLVTTDVQMLQAAAYSYFNVQEETAETAEEKSGLRAVR